MPTYQSGGTQIDNAYGIPADPLSMGLGTFLNTYASFAGNNTGRNANPYQTTQAYPTMATATTNNPVTPTTVTPAAATTVNQPFVSTSTNPYPGYPG